MSKEIVNVELDKYLFLVDFHKNIEEGNVVQVIDVKTSSYRIITKDKSLDVITNTLKNLEVKNAILERKLEKYKDFDIEEHKRLKNKIIELVNDLNVIKKLSIWQFLKFRKS